MHRRNILRRARQTGSARMIHITGHGTLVARGRVKFACDAEVIRQPFDRFVIPDQSHYFSSGAANMAIGRLACAILAAIGALAIVVAIGACGLLSSAAYYSVAGDRRRPRRRHLGADPGARPRRSTATRNEQPAGLRLATPPCVAAAAPRRYATHLAAPPATARRASAGSSSRKDCTPIHRT